MKIVFLDIDGVLSSIDTNVQIFRLTGQPTYFGPPKTSDFTRETLNWGARMVNILKMIVEATGANIVITSTWRKSFLYPYQYQQMFEAYGWKYAPVIDITTIDGKDRGSEINTWVIRAKGCDRYVIIDDNKDFSIDQ